MAAPHFHYKRVLKRLIEAAPNLLYRTTSDSRPRRKKFSRPRCPSEPQTVRSPTRILALEKAPELSLSQPPGRWRSRSADLRQGGLVCLPKNGRQCRDHQAHRFPHAEALATLLRGAGGDIKVMQELPRNASSRVIMDTYTQAVTSSRQHAQTAVVNLFHKEAKAPDFQVNSCTTESRSQLVPFCAHEKTARSLHVIDLKVASPTGFEPVLPP
jgi:hypothetical protein